jgi:hypothetical protein
LQVIILKKHFLPDIPSASGVAVVNNVIYIIGDDSSWLYMLDYEMKVVGKTALFTSPDLINGRIPKVSKPDFEALTHLNIGGKEQLLAIGSGSKSPERDNAYLVDLHNNTTRHISLINVYNQLRQLPEVIGEGKLNIEGLAADHKQILFVQRGNITGNNVLISYPAEELYQYLLEKSSFLPVPIIQLFNLPYLSGSQSGFSGITFIPGTSKLLFTASVENTANEIDDGEVLGSYIGLIDLHDHTTLRSTLIDFEGLPYLGKIESIAVQEVEASGQIQAVAVTDSDMGGSELLFLQILL